MQKNYVWILDPFSLTSIPAAFNATKYEVFDYVVSDSNYQANQFLKLWGELGKDTSVLSSKV